MRDADLSHKSFVSHLLMYQSWVCHSNDHLDSAPEAGTVQGDGSRLSEQLASHLFSCCILPEQCEALTKRLHLLTNTYTCAG